MKSKKDLIKSLELHKNDEDRITLAYNFKEAT